MERNSKKANTGADARDEHDRDWAGSPCGFQSKVAEPPVLPACFSSPSTLISESPDFALLYFSLVMDNAVPMGGLFARIPKLGDTSSSCCKEVADFGSLNLRFDGCHSSICTSSRGSASSSLSSVRGFYSSRGLPPADPAGIRPPFFIKYVFIVEFSYTRGEGQPGRPDVFPGRDCVHLRVRFPVAQGFKADVLDVLRVPGRPDVFPGRVLLLLLALFCLTDRHCVDLSAFLPVPGRSDVFPDRDRERLHVHCCLALFCCWLPSQHVRAWLGGALFSGWLDKSLLSKLEKWFCGCSRLLSKVALVGVVLYPLA